MHLRPWIKSRLDFFGRIDSWRRFAREVRRSGDPLLAALPNYPNAVLISGCQRSGTTAVSRLLTSTGQFANFWSRDDEELDAAMILCGREQREVTERICFQTTYLNDNFQEYLEHRGQFKLVWVLRNPYSVIYSMLYNWDAFALEELYDACGREQAGSLKISSALEKACFAYNGKITQLDVLSNSLAADELFVVGYEEMVASPNDVLTGVFDFVGVEYSAEYSKAITTSSMQKASALSESEKSTIDRICTPLYQAAIKEYIA